MARHQQFQALVLAARDLRYETVLKQTSRVTIFGTPHFMRGLGEWAILHARENNIDAASTARKQNWTGCFRDLCEIVDMQKNFQGLVDDKGLYFKLTCCFAKLPVQIPRGSKKSFVRYSRPLLYEQYC